MSGSEHSLHDCHIHQIGGTAVSLSGGDPNRLLPGGCVVENCRIHDWGYWQKVYAPAIALKGVGHSVRHCVITEGPHMAIEVRGNDHEILRNDISRVCLDFSDMGAIYFNLGFQPQCRGTRISGNRFHDIGDGHDEVHGIYLDNGTMGVTITNNSFERIGFGPNTTGSAIRINGGRHNRVIGNSFMDCAATLECCFHLNDWGKPYRDHYERAWRKELYQIRALSAPHFARYPELNGLLQEDPVFPDSNVFEGNWVSNPSTRRVHPEAFRVCFGPAHIVISRGNLIAQPSS
jgi:hypothetical protein